MTRVYGFFNAILFIFLFIIASIAVASLTVATAASFSGTRIREQFTYTPKGKHRRLV